MTPEEHLELARRSWDAWNRRDQEAWLELVHPDFEGHSVLVREAEGGEPFRGIDGARAWWTNLFETFEEIRVELEQLIAVGDYSLVVLTLRVTTREGGVAMEQRLAFVNEVRDGRFVYARSFLDLGEAFADMARLLRR